MPGVITNSAAKRCLARRDHQQRAIGSCGDARRDHPVFGQKRIGNLPEVITNKAEISVSGTLPNVITNSAVNVSA